MTVCEVQEVATKAEKEFQINVISLLLLAPYFNRFQWISLIYFMATLYSKTWAIITATTTII